MDIFWQIVFGILGTGVFLYLGWFILLLNTSPQTLLEMNNPKKTTWHNILVGAQFLLLGSLAIGATYGVVYWCLGWMPDDWGRVDEYGE